MWEIGIAAPRTVASNNNFQSKTKFTKELKEFLFHIHEWLNLLTDIPPVTTFSLEMQIQEKNHTYFFGPAPAPSVPRNF